MNRDQIAIREFRIEGMDCAEEIATLKGALAPIVGGVDRLSFDLLNAKMTVMGELTSIGQYSGHLLQPDINFLESVLDLGIVSDVESGVTVRIDEDPGTVDPFVTQGLNGFERVLGAPLPGRPVRGAPSPGAGLGGVAGRG
jgi:hypothetical protein